MNTKTNYVWYASYGSNLLKERFTYYIKGGYYAETGRYYSGCSRRDMPAREDYFEIPYEMYFAKASSAWERCGVAFIDGSRPGCTPARLWLVSEDQLADIAVQEGGWYSHRLYLGLHEGIPVYTLTSARRFAPNAPCQKYIDVINAGRCELQQLCGEKGYDISVPELRFNNKAKPKPAQHIGIYTLKNGMEVVLTDEELINFIDRGLIDTCD